MENLLFYYSNSVHIIINSNFYYVEYVMKDFHVTNIARATEKRIILLPSYFNT